jgi:hypothetical protein
MQAPAKATGPPSAHGLASFVVGFEEVGGRNDTELLTHPGVAVGRLADHRLRARVVGLAGQFEVGLVGHHAKHGWDDFQLARGSCDPRKIGAM